MTSFELERFALQNHNIRRNRSTSPFHPSSPFHPFAHLEDDELKTVSLSAVCKENTPYYTAYNSSTLSSPFSWRYGSPELDFTWDSPRLSRMTSPMSSNADCSFIEDGSSTVSPYVASIFEQTDYAKPSPYPSTPQDAWSNVEDLIYDSHHYQSIPFSNGSSSANLLPTCTKTQYSLQMPMPLLSQDVPLFNDETRTISCKRKTSTSKVKQEMDENKHIQGRNDGDDAESDSVPPPRKKARATRVTKNKKKNAKIPGNRQTRFPSYAKQGSKPNQHIVGDTAHTFLTCPDCEDQFPNKTTLGRHITTSHKRLFACIFRVYGCASTFGSKNEWKRHVASQHLLTAYWQCAMGRCAPSKPGDQPKQFNRKDLFMQHVRRMHMPTSLKDKEQMDASIENSTRDCYKHIRNPPSTSICGYCYAAGRREDFSGPGSWEHRMEHVGKHLESPDGEKQNCVADKALEEWLIRENLVVENETGTWILRSLVDDLRGKKSIYIKSDESYSC